MGIFLLAKQEDDPMGNVDDLQLPPDGRPPTVDRRTSTSVFVFRPSAVS
ncbi:MAG: hypothetical protein H6633_15345 [Anaerolineales bacterium]|nr:hypothetical protein [Anaerolineales bacterium]